MSGRHSSVDWDAYVRSEAFDRECSVQASRFVAAPSGSDPSEDLDDEHASGATFVDPTSHGVSKEEAQLYYFGLRGNGRLGPKLIYRTSTDVFSLPSGPERDIRMMQLLPVYDHAKLGKDGKWETIRGDSAQILDDHHISFTSIDLVRFCYETNGKRGIERVITRVTIWVGVLPNSTTGDAAFECSNDILKLLAKHDIHDVDVAFRESVARPLAGPALYAPVDDLHALKDVLDSVTTGLSLPIAGLDTLHMQGCIGFYFQVGEDPYGVTARHVLFPSEHGNFPYTYHESLQKKKVVLMGKKAFDRFLASIQALIGLSCDTVSFQEKRIVSYTNQARAGDQRAAGYLATMQRDLDRKVKQIEELRTFYATMQKDWADVLNRIVGDVVWAPSLGGIASPHGYAQDVCVIKLDKEKFLNMKGNVIDLAPEIEFSRFLNLMHPYYHEPSSFEYPVDGLYKLESILPAAEIKVPDNKDVKGEPVRFVIKHGHTTPTTVGCLAGFMSHLRRYGIGGTIDSVEVAVHAYDSKSGPFSRPGDSGSVIAGSKGEFIALLTGGTGSTDFVDITYGTPMEWLWNDIIKPQFPDAVLYLDTPRD